MVADEKQDKWVPEEGYTWFGADQNAGTVPRTSSDVLMVRWTPGSRRSRGKLPYDIAADEEGKWITPKDDIGNTIAMIKDLEDFRSSIVTRLSKVRELLAKVEAATKSASSKEKAELRELQKRIKEQENQLTTRLGKVEAELDIARRRRAASERMIQENIKKGFHFNSDG